MDHPFDASLYHHRFFDARIYTTSVHTHKRYLNAAVYKLWEEFDVLTGLCALLDVLQEAVGICWVVWFWLWISTHYFWKTFDIRTFMYHENRWLVSSSNSIFIECLLQCFEQNMFILKMSGDTFFIYDQDIKMIER